MEQKYIDLFDRYTHGSMLRREFLEKMASLAGSAAVASALLTKLENNYALAATVPEDDQRLAIETVGFETGRGSVSGYLTRMKQIEKA